MFKKAKMVVPAPRGAVLKGDAKIIWEKYFQARGKGCFKKKGMKDAEYLKKVHAKLSKFSPKARGLEKFGLELEEVSEIEPIDIYGFNWTDDVAVSPSYLMTSKYEVTWLYFSDTQIFAYTLVVDMLSESYDETLREYFYKDVTSVVTLDEAIEVELWKKGCFKPKKDYKIINKSHVQICAPGAPDFKLHVYTGDNPDFVNKMKSLKLKLREKKA